MTSLTHNHKIQITAIPLQYGISDWTLYIPFIQCNSFLLFLSAQIEPNAVNKNISILVM